MTTARDDTGASAGQSILARYRRAASRRADQRDVMQHLLDLQCFANGQEALDGHLRQVLAKVEKRLSEEHPDVFGAPPSTPANRRGGGHAPALGVVGLSPTSVAASPADLSLMSAGDDNDWIHTLRPSHVEGIGTMIVRGGDPHRLLGSLVVTLTEPFPDYDTLQNHGSVWIRIANEEPAVGHEWVESRGSYSVSTSGSTCQLRIAFDGSLSDAGLRPGRLVGVTVHMLLTTRRTSALATWNKWTDLAEGFRRRDHHVWRRRMGDGLFAWAPLILRRFHQWRGPDDLEDLVSETMRHLLECVNDGRLQHIDHPGSFCRFVEGATATVFSNRSDYWNAARRNPASVVGEPDPNEDLSHEPAPDPIAESLDWVNFLLSQLQPDDQRIAKGKILGESSREIGLALGGTAARIDQRWRLLRPTVARILRVSDDDIDPPATTQKAEGH